ncbi:MAG: photosystem I reaction center subunit XII [Cyanothece sp. SIO1E1]|nr:photosystem I reaction center subunit XII [Cyanothece sp. SIO1E1]
MALSDANIIGSLLIAAFAGFMAFRLSTELYK